MARVLGALGRTFITAGVLLFLFVGFQLWGTGLEESAGQSQVGSSFVHAEPAARRPANDDPATVAASLATIDGTAAATTPAPAEGSAGGVIKIPKIGMEKFFVEGTAKADLKKGPGHYIGTPLPGQAGNAAIAGHRTTYGAPFNRIDELVPGDRIEIYTDQGRFVYEVVAPPDGVGIERGPGWYTVRPSGSSVLDNTADNRLTLTACHPKYSAQQRIIVTAKLVSDAAPTTPRPPDRTATAASTKRAEPSADLGGDPGALLPAILFGLGAALVWLLTWLASKRFNTILCYALGAPAFFVLLWFCFKFTDHWLPSL